MQKRTYFSITRRGRGEISAVSNPVEFFCKTASQLGILVPFLGPVSQTTHSCPWNSSLPGLKDGNFYRGLSLGGVMRHRKGTGGLFALLMPGTEAMGQELPTSSHFTFLVMEIPHWCYAEFPSLPEGKHLPSWTEVLSKSFLSFLLQIIVIHRQAKVALWD